MRLYNIYYICNATVDSIKNITATHKNNSNGTTTYNIVDWKNILENLYVLRKLPFLKKEVDKMINSIPVYARDLETPEISSSAYGSFTKYRTELIIELETVIALYESMENGDAQAGIDIKIPQCSSLKEYIQYMRDIDFIFSQCPFISKSDEEIIFNTVDVGSTWLSFFIKATAGKNFIFSTLSKLTELAVKIQSNMNVLKQQDEMLKTMQQKNEIGNEVIDVFKKMKEKTLDDAVSEMENECKMTLSDPEERDRARRSLDIYAQLIDKGLEIYSSIETPKEIKVQFPFIENSPELPEGLLKLIEDKSKNEEQE